MNKKISLGAAISLMFLFAALVFAITMSYSESRFNSTIRSLQEREKNFSKLSEISQIVYNDYYGTIDEMQLNVESAKGYLAGIGDPYATYYTAAEYRVIQQEANNQGSLVGVGIATEVSADGYIVVKEVYPDSPAAIDGIQVGDLIISVDDVTVSSDNNLERMDAILGIEGTSVSLMLRRGGVDQTKELVRREVEVPTVTAQLIPDTTTAYIRISNFTSNTYNQFNTAYQQMSEAGASAIIFDVRNNSGEDVTAAIRILDRLVGEGPMLGTQYKDSQTAPVIETSNANEISLPMAVLVNEETKSAAEIFALVLHDFQKASLVGVTTAGVGVRQETFPLSDGSAIKITVAEYFSAQTNTYFNTVGVVPNYEVVLGMDWMGLAIEDDAQLLKAIDSIHSTLRTNGLPVVELSQTALSTVLTESAPSISSGGAVLVEQTTSSSSEVSPESSTTSEQTSSEVSAPTEESSATESTTTESSSVSSVEVISSTATPAASSETSTSSSALTSTASSESGTASSTAVANPSPSTTPESSLAAASSEQGGFQIPD